MSILNRLQNAINLQLANIGIKSSVLESIGKSKNYRLMAEHFESGLKQQIYKIINDGLFEDISAAIGKADHVWTESDTLEVQDAVNKKMKKHPLALFVSMAFFAAYLTYTFNKGGQSVLDKENIPKDFDLQDPEIISSIEATPPTVFSGLDATTSSWITDQIVTGKSQGVSTSDLMDMITTKVPSITASRAQTIVRTETAKSVGQAEHITAVKNGASHKNWQSCDDDRVSDECMANEDQGTIGVEQSFVSGASFPPQHPNCRCVVEYQFTPFQGTVWSGQ